MSILSLSIKLRITLLAGVCVLAVVAILIGFSIYRIHAISTLSNEYSAEGSGIYTIDGTLVALDGMKTTCGASLIACSPKGAVIS